MTDRSIDPNQKLPLTPAVFHILLALANGELHGYAIMQEVTQSTGGTIRMGPGTLYGTIKKLVAEEWIEEAGERAVSPSDDERRRYYRLTEFGAKVVNAEVRRLSQVLRSAQGKRLIVPLEGGV
ncbi:MAG: PadR family transcriptional regulator [Verrucomicrobiales bacterium]|nr:PadR family transcriptional regulator [Verrucomicrobiales bacterium]MDB6129425.1 PadR family transcriptional regulator [Verrucomicrobiales bacterium]